MCYYTVVLLFFRPFFKVELLNSNISPRQKCTQSAREISSLASTYKSIYGLRCSIVVLTHLMATACITHLIDLPDPLAARDLAQGIRHLNRLAENHAIVKRYLHITVGLSKQWRMRLAESIIQAIREVKSVAVPDVPCAPQGTSLVQTPYLSTQSQGTHQYGHDALLPNSAPIPTLINSAKISYSHTDLFWSPFQD